MKMEGKTFTESKNQIRQNFYPENNQPAEHVKGRKKVICTISCTHDELAYLFATIVHSPVKEMESTNYLKLMQMYYYY